MAPVTRMLVLLMRLGWRHTANDDRLKMRYRRLRHIRENCDWPVEVDDLAFRSSLDCGKVEDTVSADSQPGTGQIVAIGYQLVDSHTNLAAQSLLVPVVRIRQTVVRPNTGGP